ncbi:acetate--CoA ligase family protein [Crossiella sp. CA-258035]|uniref:acetate--CoA ligase family protein n=1 Tax=Crossiella sp. CA-258035 TaxID=2981138 RepID=UPI0024BC4A9E|nr:acetate--CoA ligase family protein [Crossiella sp. CA-258035]WHT22017.1 acetate--CoA ligase family protein [Crossiella sp. CA-258035]
MRNSLSALWSARSVAVVGASERPGALGGRPVQFLRRYGYQGRILPVHPKHTELFGLPAHPTVAACPGPVDLAMILVAADRVPAAIEDCLAAGVQAAIVCSSGFAETCAEGARRQEALVAQAKAGGLRILGPNCIGSVGVATGQVTSFSPLFEAPTTRLVPGSLALVSQSGALGFGAVSLAFERGLGLGWAVSTGNEAELTALEVLATLAEEPECTGLLGYVESLADVDSLRRLAAAGKPVALLKAGSSAAGARAVASHTGALATDDRVTDAVLRRYGIVRVSDVDELLDVGEAFATGTRASGDRVAVVTTSGGSGILAADALAQRGLRLAELSASTTAALAEVVPAYGSVDNPVDVTAAVMARPELFQRCLDVVAADPAVDVVLACFCVLTGSDVAGIAEGLARVRQATGKAVLVARTGAEHLAPGAGAELRRAGIPVYATPGRAVAAAAAVTAGTKPAAVAAADRGASPAPGDGPSPPRGTSEAEFKALLRAHGIPVPTGRLATSPDDAIAAVREVGGRAVLKAVVPDLVHKTEAGGVVLDVTPGTAAAEYQRLVALGGTVLVEEFVTGAVEMLVGVAPGPCGPMLALGLGGIFAEVFDDVVLAPLPVDPAEVRRMLGELRGAALLHGVRGRDPSDVDALVDLVVQVSALVAGWGGQVDLNPVAVLPRGVRVLDAVYLAEGAD